MTIENKEKYPNDEAVKHFIHIYDEIIKENQNIEASNLNLFLIRLLFCLFAEDIGIFEQKKMFTNDIKTLTKEDGSDLNYIIRKIFEALNQKEKKIGQPSFLNKYPYVNGRLFSQPHEDLQFSKRIRKLMIGAGELLNWTTVNPDILGSMIQTVATDSTRSHLGMHYTSVPNIMKVINPLFLEDLKKEFYSIIETENKNETKIKKLESLLNRIGKIKFFDPSCGSGNFLIIAYKEMRHFEMDIYEKILELKGNNQGGLFYSHVDLSQFYGIEIDDFAHDVAMLSLWIADYQMNLELNNKIPNNMRSTLPLQKVGNIRCANALRIDWNDVCPHGENDEVYVFGNPPYLGAKRQTSENKLDMEKVFHGIRNYKLLDYISAWFMLASRYIQNKNSTFAFVTTNSICQGQQVAVLWNEIFSYNLEIKFAYTSFKWVNNAKNNAGVTVSIIGVSNKNNQAKKIYQAGNIKSVSNISAYLTAGENVIVRESKTPIVPFLPRMCFGNIPNDGNGLVVELDVYNELLENQDESLKYLKKYIGASEFINGTWRYCIWLTEENHIEAEKIPFIRERIEVTRNHRLNSSDSGTNRLATESWRFRDTNTTKIQSIIIPNVSSENRLYVPMGILEKDIIITNASVIYDAPIWLLGILQSRLHMTWLRAFGGRLKTDYRYSAGMVYNTFPVPNLSTRLKNEIEVAVMKVLDIRDEEGETLAALYGSPLAKKNPKPMNKRLQLAHEQLDRVVEKAYRSEPFESDEERLEVLLSMYQKMTKNN